MFVKACHICMYFYNIATFFYMNNEIGANLNEYKFFCKL